MRKLKVRMTIAICMVLICTIVTGCVAAGPVASTSQDLEPDKSPLPFYDTLLQITEGMSLKEVTAIAGAPQRMAKHRIPCSPDTSGLARVCWVHVFDSQEGKSVGVAFVLKEGSEDYVAEYVLPDFQDTASKYTVTVESGEQWLYGSLDEYYIFGETGFLMLRNEPGVEYQVFANGKQLEKEKSFIEAPYVSYQFTVGQENVVITVEARVAENTHPTEPTQTVYLPATYKYTGEFKISNWETGHLSIERQYFYDEAGRCIRCEEVIESEVHGHIESTYQFAYDEKGNLISESLHEKCQMGDREWERSSSYTLHYTYDKYGRAEQCELEVLSGDNQLLRNTTYRFVYDAQGNLETLTMDDETWYYYSYDEQGKMIAETYCNRLPESDPNADTYKYLNMQTVYQRNTQGKVASVYSQFAYSAENVGADGLDQLGFKFNANSYTFHYDEGGNLIRYQLSAGTEVGQQKYDENGQWIPEEKHETVTIRGEEIDRLLAKYTQDEYGNIVKFENYQYTEEYTYTALELTPTQQKRAEQFFIYPTWIGDGCRLPGYVFAYFYPTWYDWATDFKYFVNFYQNLPW